MSDLIYYWTEKDYLHIKSLALKNLKEAETIDEHSIARAWTDAVIEHMTSLGCKVHKTL